jgi:glycosyltransferase involved in cell wall biosynthesis
VRLLFVTPRWGEVAGGAERAMRGFATRCCDGYDVEIATTCAIDHHTWRNELPAGVEREGDLTVRRFEVTQHGGHTPGHVGTSYLGQVRALAASVWSEPMQRFLVDQAERFDAILLAPYLFGTTFWSAAAQPSRALLVPCLHDEPEARTAPMRALLGRVRGCIFLSRAEEALARTLAPVRTSRVVGVGVDVAPPLPAERVAEIRARLGLQRPYVVSVGRVEEGKRADALVDLMAAYRRRHGDLDLVLAGSGPYRPPGWVKRIGFLDDEARRAVVAGAIASVSASRMESFSLVLLEAWSEGTPTLSDAACGPMAEHTRDSGGGLVYHGAGSFTAGLQTLLQPGARERFGAAGRAYVLDRYSWDAVRDRFRSAVEELACAS